MADRADEIKPPVASSGPLGWVRANLVDTWYNALLTVAVLAALYYVVRGFAGWALNTAEWAVLTQNLQVLLVGQYSDEEVWRAGVVMLALPFVLGLGWSVWPGFCRRLAISLAVAAALLAALPVEFASLGPGFRIYLLLNTVLVGTGWLVGRYTVLGQARRVLGIWLLLFLGGLVFLRGFDASEALPFVGTKQWGGLMVTLLLAQAGIVISFPLGILFALGRRSSMAFVRVACIAYIEVLRGTPILALLFVTQVLLPLLLPDWMDMGPAHARADRADPQQLRVHGGEHPRRPAVGAVRPARGGARARHEGAPHHRAHRAAAGAAQRAAGDRRAVHHPVQGHRGDLAARTARLPRHRQRHPVRAPHVVQRRDRDVRVRGRGVLGVHLRHDQREPRHRAVDEQGGRLVAQGERKGNKERNSIIVVRELHKWFGDFHVLRGISMEIYEGEKMVIFGPSGSGKSTFIRTLNRLEVHQRGDIIVDGIELSADIRNIDAIRSEIGMVFQSFNLFPHLTVIDNITLAPILVRRMSKEDANELAMQYLERVGIPEQAVKYPGQLSGGQQQRVAIARALAMQPKIMMFDEPTSALDPEMIKEVLDVMVELAESGMTMIVVTHEMGFARQVGDRMVMFDEGKVVEIGTPDEVLEHPRHERTQQFLAQILT